MRVAGKKSKKAGGAAAGAAKGTVRPGKKGKRYGSLGSTDEQLMAKLGETVQGMKEDFIVVHLREPCSYCRSYISDSNRCGGCMFPGAFFAAFFAAWESHGRAARPMGLSTHR